MKTYYLDNAATTVVSKDVVDVIFDTMNENYGNPSSLHDIGQRAKITMDKSRQIIARKLNCASQEIIFTSGACEANSLAIQGFMKCHDSVLITSVIEHKSIFSLCENNKYETYFVDVDNEGFIDLIQLEDYCKKASNERKDILVSIQGANSEIGTLQDIKKITDIVHKYHGIVHSDITQLLPYSKIDIKKLNLDMASASGQKINAPKGIGILYVKRGILLEPLIYGSQEFGLRGGTENIPYIAGLAKAFENISDNNSNIQKLRDYMETKLLSDIPFSRINGSKFKRSPNNINISFKGIEAETLLLLLNIDGIYVSSGSACNSKNISPSPTLVAINVPNDYIKGTIRITIPENLTVDDADYIVSVIQERVKQLRNFSNKDVSSE